MTASGFQLDTRDLNRLKRQFQGLGQNVGTRVARNAVSAGATPVLQAARREVPEGETGNLKKSLGRKTKGYKAIHTAVAYIGARIGGSHRGYHAHLVENGHVNVDGSFTPGNPWLQRATQASEASAISRMNAKLIEGIQKEAARA